MEVKTQNLLPVHIHPRSSCISSHSDSGTNPIGLLRKWSSGCLCEVHVVVYVNNHGYNDENCSGNEDTFPQTFTGEVLSINNSPVFGVIGILFCTSY